VRPFVSFCFCAENMQRKTLDLVIIVASNSSRPCKNSNVKKIKSSDIYGFHYEIEGSLFFNKGKYININWILSTLASASTQYQKQVDTLMIHTAKLLKIKKK
jgi:hypothetical protein